MKLENLEIHWHNIILIRKECWEDFSAVLSPILRAKGNPSIVALVLVIVMDKKADMARVVLERFS